MSESGEPENPVDAELEELEDGVDTTSFALARLDVGLLTSPAVLRAFGGIALGLAVLAWPNRSERVFERLIGIALIWMAIAGLRSLRRPHGAVWLTLVPSIISLVIGVFLVVDPDESTVVLGRILGTALIVSAIRRAVLVSHTHPDSTTGRDRRSGRLALQALVAAIGFLLIILTEAVLETVIVIGAICWIVASVIVLVVSLDARTSGVVSYLDTTELVSHWLAERPKGVDARQALYDKILYEGPLTQTRVVRFFALMTFASVIASMGVISDSTAVVIGAMLVAPLMTPLMGMAISLVMGWPNRLTRSALVAFGGILLAIGIGVLLGSVAPGLIDTATNSQIIARTTPTDVDLIIAIAAGAAGAYGLSRPDVSDALPGVAIAISLVPPLSVVGISYSQSDWSAGNGALLLFATNMIAILLVGGLTFVFTGVTPIARAANNQHRVRTAVGVTCTAAVLVFGGLLLNGAQLATDVFQQSTVDETVAEWLGESPEHRVFTTDIEGNDVSVVVVGPADGLPDVESLADRLSDDLDTTITVEVSLVIEERFVATGG